MIRPCVEASINTSSLDSPLSSSHCESSQFTSPTSFKRISNQMLTQIPVMKFLIKFLQFFSLSCPTFEDDSKNHQQQTLERDNTKSNVSIHSKPLNALPPFAKTTAMIFFIQLFSFIFVLNIEEFSPLVMFSYWRNKIS